MPWIYNPSRDPQLCTLNDGTLFGFLPRKRVFVAAELVPPDVLGLLSQGKLINQGGDPQASLPEVLDTSSAHHPPDASVSLDSPEPAEVIPQDSEDGTSDETKTSEKRNRLRR